MSIRTAWRAVGGIFGSLRGAATVEFALLSTVIIFMIANAIDLGYYIAVGMIVNTAAQMGAQAAWQTCGVGPAASYCPGMNAAVTTAVQSTTLGTAISLSGTTEAYYCVNSSGSLVQVGPVSSSKPANCTSAGVSTNTPGDWVTVSVTYTFKSFFPGVSITRFMPATITDTAWMRLG